MQGLRLRDYIGCVGVGPMLALPLVLGVGGLAD